MEILFHAGLLLGVLIVPIIIIIMVLKAISVIHDLIYGINEEVERAKNEKK